ncbi:MAG TPA: hypothetical protein PKO15_16605 [Fibrobacteria bacterium]|nr:hypothetical protein [Fibrobacteria bacterium]HOX50673.1 hypothetical protein [Fibrobacteria bacterium]
MKARLLLCALVLAGCDSPNVAAPVEGGNPTKIAAPVEGGNPVLAARVVGAAGVVRPGMAVQLWEIADDSTHLDTFRLLGESRADDQGWVRFRGRSGIPWVMLVTDSLEGATLEGYGISEQAGQLSVARWGSVRGVWKGRGSRPKWVGLARLPVRAQLQRDGSYYLPHVPWGHRVLVEGPATGRAERAILASLEVLPGSHTELDSGLVTTNSVLIDDFEQLGNGTRLQGLVPQGTWNFKAPNGDTSRIEPGNLEPKWFDVTRMDGDDGRGKAWKVRVDNQMADTSAYGGVVLELGKEGVDASFLDSLTFRMRGNGRFQINLVGTKGRMVGIYTMPSTWGDVTIHTTRLTPYGATSEEVLGSLVRIEWILRESANTEFWLDDLVAWGWNP